MLLLLPRAEVEYTFPKSAEGEVQVQAGELLTGVLDKAVYGKFGLVHAVQVRACLGSRSQVHWSMQAG